MSKKSHTKVRRVNNARVKPKNQQKNLAAAAAVDERPDAQRIIEDFHKLYYASAAYWDGLKWFGWPMAKCPFDLWIYQEIIAETQPEVIIETGTFLGGSALYLASLLSFLGEGRGVISIDLAERTPMPTFPGLSFLAGRSSTDPDVVAEVAALVEGRRTMVVLDSDHSCEHVQAELEAYAPLVSPGCFLIVEDTNVNGRPVYPNHGPGPMEALLAWLPLNPEFKIDQQRERLLLTTNPCGYLIKGGVTSE